MQFPRPRTFRWKLLLAMMAVVLGTLVIGLIPTHRSVTRNYRMLLERQARKEMDSFFQLQESRLATIRQKCIDLSHSVRLLAAMSELHLEDEDIYAIAEGEIRNIDGDRFLRFLDSSGKLLVSNDSWIGMTQPYARTIFESRLKKLGPSLASNLDAQQMGYTTISLDESKTQLYAVIATPILDNATSLLRGVLIMGFPIELEGTIKNQSHTPFRIGIWMENALYSDDLSPEEQNLLTSALSHQFTGHHPLEFSLPLSIHGHGFLVFARALNQLSSFPTAYQIQLYSLEELEHQLRELASLFILLAIVSSGVALVLGLFFSRTLSRPIHNLVKGTQKVQSGDFSTQLPILRDDELGTLTRSFNQMVEGLALKEKFHSILQVVTDRKIAEQLISGALMLGGEKRVVSILFCDIRGFTRKTEKMPPEEVIQMLNEHMTALAHVVEKQGGVVDKFVGDLIMALFGAPQSHEDDAVRSVACALEMMSERKRLNRDSRYSLEMGIGIARGEVVAGCMGSEQRNNYTVLGDKVNLASRLCGQAGPGEILVDEPTWLELNQKYRSEPLTDLKLKGFSDSMKAHRILIDS